MPQKRAIGFASPTISIDAMLVENLIEVKSVIEFFQPLQVLMPGGLDPTSLGSSLYIQAMLMDEFTTSTGEPRKEMME
ncbi:hypothetical protein GOP47_0025307 [Adiantum capillus-veneris]|uniref:Uncharacterized protein n=1 Tax=Adiantum capillus-veneris TaxID=13818 RepID=A0A9D4Z278_ADICA|nr:hypothetical protein GOP47_0025307 [Adiantum capillus-veneris]